MYFPTLDEEDSSSSRQYVARYPKLEPKEFKGRVNEDVEEWVRHFEATRGAAGWDATRCLRLVPVYLTEAAGDWWKEEGLELAKAGVHDTSMDGAWNNVLEAIVKRFIDPMKRENARIQVRNRVQRKDERVREYMSALEGLFQKAGIINDEERQRYFEDGLITDVRLEVLRQRPRSLRSAYTAACEWETVQSRINTKPPTRTVHVSQTVSHTHDTKHQPAG